MPKLSTDTHVVEIQVTTPRALEEQLEAAVQYLQGLASPARTRGILITRHQPGEYTAKLSEKVPYGITRERYS